MCENPNNKCKAARKYSRECEKIGVSKSFYFEECGDFASSSTVQPVSWKTDPAITVTPLPSKEDDTYCRTNKTLKDEVDGFCEKIMFENSLQNVMCSKVRCWHNSFNFSFKVNRFVLPSSP